MKYSFTFLIRTTLEPSKTFLPLQISEGQKHRGGKDDFNLLPILNKFVKNLHFFLNLGSLKGAPSRPKKHIAQTNHHNIGGYYGRLFYARSQICFYLHKLFALTKAQNWVRCLKSSISLKTHDLLYKFIDQLTLKLSSCKFSD